MTRTCTKMSVNYLLIIGFILIHRTIGQSVIDSRCYLAGGGSAESLTASEDLSVGSVIGPLSINGNPRLDNGNISLSIRERDAPISIAPGTKTLVLDVALDREGKNGPSSVYVNVICVRLHSTDPSFVIPVNVRVVDVNDNAPQWIGAPYILSISEVTVPGTRILQGARAVDEDGSGPFSTVEYRVLDGPYADYVTFVTPLEGTLVLRKPLDYETVRNFTLTLSAQDQGTPPRYTDTTLDVIIIDADDQNPKFLRDSYWAELPTDGRVGELKIMPEPIRAVDQDEGILAPIRYALMNSPESRFFDINARTGSVTIKVPLGQMDLVHSITLVVRATQVDDNDRYALATLIVARKDSERNRQFDGFAFVQTKFYARVNEDIGIGSRLMALPTNRPGRPIQYYIIEFEPSQTFRIGPLGEVILQKPLDYENQTKHVFHVFATDGTANATAEVIIDILDVNDWEPRFRQTNYDFVIPKLIDPAQPFPLGKLEAADGDRFDKVSVDLRGSYADYFHVDTEGMLWLKPNAPNVSVMHLVATATDTGLPTRTSSVPITITNNGIELAQSSWAPSILGAFFVVFTLFVFIILGMCFYIYKQKEPKITGRNRVHSHDHSSTSGSKLVLSGVKYCTMKSQLVGSNEHGPTTNGTSEIHVIKNPSLRLANPLATLSTLNNNHHFAGSGSSISAGASTILAATLEREAQRDRDMENYTATVRSITSIASAARGGTTGQLYDDDLEHDSISNSETHRNQAWNLPEDTRAMHMPNKLSWSNGGLNPLRKTDTVTHSNDVIDSAENAVYF